MKNEKKVKQLFEDSEDCYLVATKNGTAIVGTAPSVLTLLTMLLESFRECDNITDKLIERALKLSRLTDKERRKELLDTLKQMLEKMN